MSPLDEIRQMYFNTSKSTIARDLSRAIELLKSLPDEEERQKAAVFMDGLQQMKLEWGVKDSATPGRAGGLPKPRRQ